MKRAFSFAAARRCRGHASAVAVAFVLAILIVLLPTCTGIVLRTGYRNADHLLLLDLEKYFDLSSAQREDTKRLLRSQLAWHRRTELPRYAAALADLKVRLQRGLTPADVTWLYAQARRARIEVMRHATPDMATFLASITPEQTAHLAQHIEEFNKDLTKAVADSSQARLKKRQADLIEMAEDWIGRLQPEQKQRIETAATRLPDMPPAQLRYRRQRQRDFLALMNERPGRERLQKQLDAWLVQPESSYPPEYAAATREWNAEMQALILSLEASLSPEQREHAMKHVDSFLSDIRELSN